MPDTTTDGVSGTSETPNHRQSYGFILWLLMGLLLIFVLFYVAWYVFQHQLKRSLQIWLKQRERQQHSRNDPLHHHHSVSEPLFSTNDLQVKEDVISGGNLAVAGMGTFRDGIVVNEIAGFRGESVHIVNPLVATGGFYLPVQNVLDLKFNVNQSRFYRYMNNSGNQTESVLPLAKQQSGAVIIIKNETAYATIKVSAQGSDTINQSQNHIFIPTFALFISNGDTDWLAIVE